MFITNGQCPIQTQWFGRVFGLLILKWYLSPDRSYFRFQLLSRLQADILNVMNFMPCSFSTFQVLVFLYCCMEASQVFSGRTATEKSQNYTFPTTSERAMFSAIHTCHMLQIVSGQHMQDHFTFLLFISRSWYQAHIYSVIGVNCLGSWLMYTNY